MPEETSADDEIEVRRFEPWRCAKTERTTALVREIARHLIAEEEHRGWRRRARRPADLATFEATVEAIVCDLAHVHLSRAPDAPRRLIITRDKARLASGPPRYRAPAFSEQLPVVLDRMHTLGHLVQRIGDRSCHAHVFTKEFGQTRPRQATTIEPGPTLLWRTATHGVTFADLGINPGGEIIILRRTREDRWDTASPIDYAETQETRRYREELRDYNAWLAAADIQALGLPHIDAGDRHLVRAFTYGSFRSGGRLAGSAFWANMPRELRLSHLRIGGEPIVSLDFANLNVHLAYARAGVAPPAGDLYGFPGLAPYRVGMKRLLNARFFDRGPRRSKPRRTPGEVRERVQLYPHNVDVAELLRIIEDAHRPVAHYFGTGIGHELQFTESQILMRILGRLRLAGVIALPLHDCVLVPKSAVQMARAAMSAAAMAEIGVAIPVTVEEGTKVSTSTQGGAGGL